MFRTASLACIGLFVGVVGFLSVPSSLYAGFELISHWTLNEASGARVDSEGDNDLSTVNSTPMVVGQVGNAASFPTASSTYLTIDDNASLSTTGDTTFKISMWVKLLAKSTTQVFVSKYAASGQGEYAVYYEHAFRRFVFSTYAGGSGNHYVLADTLGEPSVDTWYYIEVTHDGVNNRNTITVNETYTNALTSVPDHQDTTAAFRIGAFGATPSYFANAVIDDVKFYKAIDTPVSDDLVAHWKFDEGSGTTAVDSSGNEHHGVIVSTTYSDTVPEVDFDNTNSLYFNSASSGRIVTTGLSLNNYSGFTLTGWAYPTAANNRASWFGQNDVFEFGFTDSDTLFCYTSRGEASWDFDPGTFLNEWHYITCLGDDDELIIYVDGENVASDDSLGGGTYGSSGSTFSIGAGAVDGGTTGPFTGYIDDVRVYSRGLSPQELQSLADGADEPTDAPGINILSPLDNATGVAVNANLSALFSSVAIATSTGSIGIYTAEDDELFESIPVTSSLITKSGATMTINPAGTFDEYTEYYVSIPGTAFSADGSFYPGTLASTTWSFTTGDFTAPSLSSVSVSSTASTSATVIWTSNELTSSRVVYGLTSALGTQTAETDTAPRVTSHSVALSGLLACTLYHYSAVSRDVGGNAATSTPATFITSGCEGSATPITATSTAVTASSGGSTSITESSKTFTVTAPENATATSSSFVIQIKAVSGETVLGSTGRPSAAPNEVGATVFEVKAIIDGDTILDSFDAEITIEYEYDDSEISEIDELSLWLYHYTGGEWEALNDCTVDMNANTISCTTPSFSIFGLFGSESAQDTESRETTGTSFDDRVRSLLRSGNVQKAWDLAERYPTEIAQRRELYIEVLTAMVESLFGATYALADDATTATVTTLSVRDLEVSMEGSDVRALQELLNANGYPLALSGIGSTGNETEIFGLLTEQALARYQRDNSIVPAVGYFGSVTRASMKEKGLVGVWW